MADQQRITVTRQLVNVLAASVGANLTPSQFVATGTNNDPVGGCIRHLYYQNESKTLTYVEFDNGDVINVAQSSNLNDFREGFECAAKFGFGATICRDRQTGKLTMLNLYPCVCKCRKDKKGIGHGRPAEDFYRF